MTGRSYRAQISGLGLVTALGDTVETNVAALIDGEPAPDWRRLDTFDEPIDVPYLSLCESDRRAADPAAADVETFAPVGHAVERALSGAGLDEGERRKIPVFVGSSSYSIGRSETIYSQALDRGDHAAIPVPLPGFSQVSRYLRAEHGLYGTDFLFNTACTSSANALLTAADAIESGQCEHALVIGMELVNITTLAGFYGMQLLTNDRMRPFDVRRDGLVLGEGCGAVLLSAAQPGADGIFIAGGASGCDTFSISTSNPDGTQIAAVMREALANAGIGVGAIAAIKAHGTASPTNDDAEAAGMHQVFETVPPFFALKPCIGHTLGACGVVETGLVAGALLAGTLPPTGGFAEYDEKLGVQPLTKTLDVGAGHYMLNFFGFGGNNASVILEYVRRDV